jgi:hypothetical protein
MILFRVCFAIHFQDRRVDIISLECEVLASLLKAVASHGIPKRIKNGEQMVITYEDNRTFLFSKD